MDRQEAILDALRACPLYFILDESLLARHDPRRLARSVIRAGVRMLQLRIKSASSRELLELATRLTAECRAGGCLLIVNDRLDIALLSGADGVHLGPEDVPVAEARRIAPELIIGASARIPRTAWQAEVAGADYVGCGSVFKSRTKRDATVIGPQGLSKVDRYISIPVVGIGGITSGNCAEAMATGVIGCCAISEFAQDEPAGKVTQRFIKASRGAF